MGHTGTARIFDEWSRIGKGRGMEEGHALTGLPALEGLRLPAGGRFLDLGCGNGWATRRALSRARLTQVVGVDASREMVREARATTAEQGVPGTQFLCCDFEALPFTDGAFGAAFSMEALYYAADLDAALGEIARVLEPGAHARVVIDHYEENEASHGWPALVGVPMHRLAETEWAKRFLAAGFKEANTARLRVPENSAQAARQPWIAEAGSLLLDLVR